MHTFSLPTENHSGTKANTFWLSFQSIGIIYGDIGTSPLYVLASIYTEPPNREQVFGALSLIFWSFTIVVVIKYASLILRADDDGEGGTFALYSILCKHLGLSPILANKEPQKDNLFTRSPKSQLLLLLLVLIGVSLILGDGVLTPAISVLSAVEGISTAAPSFQSAVVPISCVVILLLFSFQSYGTSKVSSTFAPIVLIWLISLASIGVWNITQNTEILQAASPLYAIRFFLDDSFQAWTTLSGVLLAITGLEALYADLGHFNRHAIQISTICLAYPALMAAYFGQGARLLNDPNIISTVFWSVIPKALYWPVFVLAVLATIIASQAMISASFSLIYQAMNIGCFPRLPMHHTSTLIKGQIYIGTVNWFLCLVTILVIIGFQKSANLTIAYGIAIASIMFITDILFTILLAFTTLTTAAIVYFLIFGTISLLFLSSSLHKFIDGGWLPIVIALVITLIMNIWRWAESIKKVKIDSNAVTSLGDFLEWNESTENYSLISTNTPITKTSGMAFFYSSSYHDTVPKVFLHFLNRFNVIHKYTVFINMKTVFLPIVDEDKRIHIENIAGFDNFYKIWVMNGYMDQPIKSTLLAHKVLSFANKEEVEIYVDNGIDMEIMNNQDHMIKTFVTGKIRIYAKQNSNIVRRTIIQGPYRWMNNIDQSLKVDAPFDETAEIGMKFAI